ncbi:MAG: hypothetical protein KAX78_06295 [Phycisphaerae bacterium]|nr:hypothetical protein [Phycisphaerae bacterium]
MHRGPPFDPFGDLTSQRLVGGDKEGPLDAAAVVCPNGPLDRREVVSPDGGPQHDRNIGKSPPQQATQRGEFRERTGEEEDNFPSAAKTV